MTVDPDILDLIHADIDGVATEHDRVRLREALARDPEVRDEYRRLRGLGDLLARVGHEAPSASLAPAVMQTIRSRRTTRSGLATRVRQSWPDGRSALRYAYAVAAGAALGVLGLHWATVGGLIDPAVPERDAVATMAPVHADHLDLAPAGIRGFATLRPTATGAAVGVDFNSPAPFELVLRYDPVRTGNRVDVLVVRNGETSAAGSLRLPGKN